MVINEIKIELVLGERWKTEKFPMFVYMIRINGTLGHGGEFATVEDAKATAEEIVRYPGNHLG